MERPVFVVRYKQIAAGLVLSGLTMTACGGQANNNGRGEILELRRTSGGIVATDIRFTAGLAGKGVDLQLGVGAHTGVPGNIGVELHASLVDVSNGTFTIPANTPRIDVQKSIKP